MKEIKKWKNVRINEGRRRYNRLFDELRRQTEQAREIWIQQNVRKWSESRRRESTN